jgi:chloramphenicol-sensitive protein RarD
MTPSSRSGPGAGIALGIGAYAIWGCLPLFLKLLAPTPPLQILAHRVVWSLLLLAVVVTALGRWPAIRAVARDRRTLLMLALSATLIACNWLVYIWAVIGGHVLAASLGYFINPLVNVVLGVAILGERLRRLQGIAVGVAAIGVAALALSGGGGLWIAIALALTFGFYGLIRKLVPAEALEGLLIETALLGPLALGWLLWAAAQGTASFGAEPHHDALLVMSGVVTAMPLLMFSAAARRMRFATLGLLQYLAPTLQFLQAVLLFGERMSPVHIFTFGCIWAGLALYAIDGLRGGRTEPVAPPE